MRSFELALARRLGWKPEGRSKVSPAVGVAVAGVALSVVVMLLSVAVMLGFKSEVSNRLMSLDDAVTITGYNADGDASDFNPAEVLSVISLPEGASVSGRVTTFGLLKTPDDFMAVELEGNDCGALPDSAIWISNSTALKLKLQKGDKIPTYFFINNRLRVRSLTVDSLYSTGFSEHDDMVAYASPAMIRQLLDIPGDNVHELALTNIAADEITPLAGQFHSELLSAYYSGQLDSVYGISTIFQTDANFFSWLALLDTNVIVILVLMGGIAAFTLISSLFIIILERVRTIGLLKALGASNAQIRRVFMLMAERLVFRGLLWGNIIGLGLTVMQWQTHLIPLNPESYYVDFVPVEFNLWYVLGVNVGAIVLSWIVLMIPAMIVARISPASTMRYE